MGRAKRERRERVIAGLEEPISPKHKKLLGNPISRLGVKLASREGVVRELSAGDVTDQVARLDSLRGTGNIPGGKLKKALMDKAPGEMDKAIRKYRKQGREITVDLLCEEVKTTPGFLQMCNNVGIELKWFEDLARQRMEAHGL